MAPQDSHDIEAYSPAASCLVSRGRRRSSSNRSRAAVPPLAPPRPPPGDLMKTEGAKIAGKTAFPFLFGPRVLSSPMAASDSDDDGGSWVGFSGRTGGGASTSTSSPGTYDHRTFFRYPPSYEERRDQLFEELQNLLAVKKYLEPECACRILRCIHEDEPQTVLDLDERVECNSNITVALSMMDEWFSFYY